MKKFKKPKYRLTKKVYFLSECGFEVYWCMVTGINNITLEPLYNLTSISGNECFSGIEEKWLSTRPERFKKQAYKAIKDYYDPLVNARDNYLSKLAQLK